MIENPGPDELLVVSIDRARRAGLPAAAGGDRPLRRPPELRADAKRTFRYLVNQDAGCLDATQFVGIVEPCRAPDHSHTYDEVGYIVEGEGFAHIGGESIPLRPGSCFHLPPSRFTASRTRGRASMRILGVFHPSGDPASRAYEDNSQLIPAS